MNLFVSVSSINCVSVLQFFLSEIFFSTTKPLWLLLNNLLVSGSSITSPLVSQLWLTWLMLASHWYVAWRCWELIKVATIPLVSVTCHTYSRPFCCQWNSRLSKPVSLTWSIKNLVSETLGEIVTFSQPWIRESNCNQWSMNFLSVKVGWHKIFALVLLAGLGDKTTRQVMLG